MTAISNLRGLGEKSAAMLAAVDINTEADLQRVGPINAYIAVQDQTNFNPGRNLLYAMIGALEDQDWKTIAQEQRSELILALEGHEKLKELFKHDGY